MLQYSGNNKNLHIEVYMAGKLLLYLTLLGIGLMLGRKGIFGEKVYSKLDFLQMLCLMLLLFTMGANLGSDETILSSIATIGLSGISMGIATIIFSVLAVKLYTKFVMKGRGEHD